MRPIFILGIWLITPMFLIRNNAFSQDQAPWTLQQCIDYALGQNIQVRQSYLTNESNDVVVRESRAARFPSVTASAKQSFGWAKNQNLESTDNHLNGSNGTSYSLNASVRLFNGMKINNTIRQAMLDYESGNYNSDAIKEAVSLSIVDAYLQILYAEELVANSRKQVEATTEQLNLASERLAISVISESDFLQVKSDLANEKLTLANAESQLNITRVNLMQLMEMPVTPGFRITEPNLDSLIDKHQAPVAQEIYNKALEIKPQIKSAELNKDAATLGIRLAKADYIPYLSLTGTLGTGYSSLLDMNYTGQLNRQINPGLALALTIPIYQNRQVKSRVELADIGVRNAELNEINTKNQLRKSIEQASVDVTSAQTRYEASLDQYQAANESYALSEEKFKQGMINSVDFLIQKTNQIVAESNLLQSKFNLIFSYKVLDFYTGVPLSL